MAQDFLGYVWIGTANGLTRFDGLTATTYHHDGHDRGTLSGNTVQCLLEDASRTLWVGTNTGLGVYNRLADSFTPIAFLGANSERHYRVPVFCLAQDPEGRVWAITDHSQELADILFAFDTLANAFVGYLRWEPERMRNFHPRSLLADRQGGLWIGTLDQGLYTLNRERRTLDPALQAAPMEILDMAQDRHGAIWFTSSNGLHTLHPTTGRAAQFRHDPHDPGSLSSDRLLAVHIDPKGRVWVGTEDQGLNMLSPGSRTFTRFLNNPLSQGALLSDRNVRAIMVDRQQNLWVGSGFGGVSYAELDPAKRFFHIARNPNVPHTLSSNAVSAVVKDRRGNLWIGTDGYGLNLYNPATGHFTHLSHTPGNPATIGGNAVLALMEDTEGYVWAGTYFGGISRIDPRSLAVRNFVVRTEGSQALRLNDVRSILQDRDGNIWAATNGMGIFRLDRQGWRIAEHHRHNPSNPEGSLSNDWTICLYEDTQGVIWIGSYHGLTRFDRITGQFTPFYPTPDDPTSLPHGWVYSLAQDALGHLWVGTAAGLARKNANGTFTRVLFADPALRAIRSMARDEWGYLWVGTGEGLVRFNPMSLEYQPYGRHNGLPVAGFTAASHGGRNLELFFGTAEGLLYFHPGEILPELDTHPVVITRLLINHREVSPADPEAPIDQHISQVRAVELSHRQNNLGFGVQVFNFAPFAQYQYKLEGFDTDWHIGVNPRVVSYTNVPPGRYTFRVRAANGDGVWHPEFTAVQIRITPPLWLTWWFLSLAVGLGAALLLLLGRYRVGRVQRRAERLELAVEHRTEELSLRNSELEAQADELNQVNTLLEERQQLIEEQAERLHAQKEELEQQKAALEAANAKLGQLNATKDKFFSIIAHDLKNPFNVLLGFSELLIANQDRYDKRAILERVKLINESSQKIYGLLLNLLDWARSQRGLIQPNPSVFSFRAIVESNLALVKESAEGKGITICTKGLTPPLDLFADRDLLDTVLRNLLSNAIKYTHRGGAIWLSARHTEQSFVFSVRDSGVGIDPHALGSLFSIVKPTQPGTGQEQGSGIGLLLCKEFVDLHRGSIWAVSQPGEGSTFSVSIPQQINF